MLVGGGGGVGKVTGSPSLCFSQLIEKFEKLQ